MGCLFKGCKSLSSIDLSNFNTDKLENMNGMFYECEKLNEINLNNFNTKNVTDMDNLFDGCKSLKKSNVITHDFNILNYNL